MTSPRREPELPGVAGRRAELAEIQQIIDRAERGFGQALLIVGEAGIGKSTLLAAVGSLVDGDAIVLSARAVESESHLAYAATVDLFGPLLELPEVADGLAVEARQVLEGVLTARPGIAGPMPVCRAALGAVLAASAGGRLIVFVVDDAQWLDEPSAEVLLYLARRVNGERVVFIAGLRADSNCRLAGADLPELHIGGLSVSGVEQLLARHRLAEPVAATLREATGGNPLALIEIVRTLSADERSARVELPHFPSVGPTITRAFSRRIGALPAPCRQALVVAAAEGSGQFEIVQLSLNTLGYQPDVLEAAEREQIIAVKNGSISFTHPLMRLVAYGTASPAERRAVHAALAGSWSAQQPSRAAWHLSESAAGPDEVIAASLEAVAAQSRTRLAATAAAELFERAGDLSTDPPGRERRWMAAARCFEDAGRPFRADHVLQRILAVTVDARMRADAMAMHGLYVAFGESPTVACELLRTEAMRIEAEDPQRAILLLATAYTAALLAVDFTVGGEIAADAVRLSSGAGPIGVLAANAMQMQAALFDGRSDDAEALLDPIARLAVALAAGGAPEADYLLQTVALAYLVTDRWHEAQSTVGAVIRRGRAAGRDGGLVFALAIESEAGLRTGRWPDAYVAARRAGDLYADPTDRQWATYSSLALCARVEAHLGLADECRDHAQAVIDGAGKLGSVVLVTWARHALGLLALSTGDYPEAIRQLEQVLDVAGRSGVHDPGYIWWPGDLIEAYWRMNRTAEATRIRARLATDAQVTGRLSAQVVVARADALLGPPERAEEAFARSLDLAKQVDAPFETARTQLLLGEWRAARGGAPDGPLTSALTTFQRLGASAWVTRCRLLGETAATPQLASPTRLLADRELEAALLAARGMTNREIADELYLSPKTVENTLGKVYRKLSVRSRTQLAILLLNSAG
jgi:DNA-binding CsgD family transcriptional regulator